MPRPPAALPLPAPLPRGAPAVAQGAAAAAPPAGPGGAAPGQDGALPPADPAAAGRDARERPGDTGAAPRISVVITAHDEGAHIRATLAALAAQRALPEGGLEVVLIDDRSTDDTVAEAGAAGLPGLRLMPARLDPHSPLTTRQQALALGFAMARGEVILTLDADSAMPPDWAARMAGPILQGRADAVIGPVRFAPARGAVALWQNCDAGQYHLISALMVRTGAAGGALFGNFAFRRALWDRVGGFGHIGFALTEDLALGQALHRAGARISQPLPGIAVTVRACPGWAALVARTRRIARGPVSALAAVLALWPLSLVALGVWAMAGGGAAVAGAFAARYLAGVAVVLAGMGPQRSLRQRAAALIHEPMVFVLAASVAVAALRGTPQIWGGRQYGP